MAKEAVAAVGFLMQRHKLGIGVFVAGRAGSQGNGVVGFANVAGGAV